ncbi:M48 metallopeptidase family protein [Nocardioides donggukensis]|uniref:M48 family metallopeptidase n=1 Tax=Nocardioides donggukensis TaxID=2774019 RepID=A0A927K4T7_9ACTN|nr:M48 family metallopeptidase [Nocardioides donggukensis]MBD8870217.1 M48 family metallopeptidase [Nocardioides donggukensis]
MDGPEVEVRRSKRRRRTVSAYRDGDKVVVLIPASMTRAQEAEWVQTMVGRLQRSERRRRPSDGQLLKRARELSDTYLGGLAQPETVRWVENQRSRWGSCTPGDRSIRLSTRLQGMPGWVVDYVLVHELAHLLEHGHDAAFWAWVEHYPRAERAQGYLQGYSAAAQLGAPGEEQPGEEGGTGREAGAADDVEGETDRAHGADVEDGADGRR